MSGPDIVERLLRKFIRDANGPLETVALVNPDGPEAAATITALREALEWYGEQARLCRLIHSGGDEGRANLSADGGSKARAALERTKP